MQDGGALKQNVRNPSLSPENGQNSQSQFHTTDTANAPYHCILLVSSPTPSASSRFSSSELQPGSLLVGPNGQVRLASRSGGEREGPADLCLTVFSLSEQCKHALSVSSEDDYARALVEWCNSGDAGLGVMLRALSSLASLPCLPGSSQSMTINSSVPWPKPVLMVGSSQAHRHYYGLITTGRCMPCDDSSIAPAGERMSGASGSGTFIMLEHSLGARLDSPSFPLHQLARSTGHTQPPWAEVAPDPAQPSLQLQPLQPNRVMPPHAIRSMLVAAEAPCMLTLITEQVCAAPVVG